MIKQDIESINKALIHLRENRDNSQSMLKINFVGWGENCEIYKIKEIRNYVSKLFRENKDLFYFLTEEDGNSKMILACLANFKAVKKEGCSTVFQDFNVPDRIAEEIIESIIIGNGYDEKKSKEKVMNLFANGLED